MVYCVALLHVKQLLHLWRVCWMWPQMQMQLKKFFLPAPLEYRKSIFHNKVQYKKSLCDKSILWYYTHFVYNLDIKHVVLFVFISLV